MVVFWVLAIVRILMFFPDMSLCTFLLVIKAFLLLCFYLETERPVINKWTAIGYHVIYYILPVNYVAGLEIAQGLVEKDDAKFPLLCVIMVQSLIILELFQLWREAKATDPNAAENSDTE